MNSDGKSRGGRGTSIASKPFIPGETPMSPLCPGHDRLVGHQRCFLGWRGRHHDDGFAAEHVEPMATDLTTWPILPKDRSMREDWYWFRKRRRRSHGRYRGKGLVRREREDHRTDASWFAAGRAFLTLSAQLASAAIADAGRIQQTIRAMALRSAFLRIERMMGGTKQASIRLKRESRAWKAPRKRPLCPLRGAIDLRGRHWLDGWWWLGGRRWLDGWWWLGGRR